MMTRLIHQNEGVKLLGLWNRAARFDPLTPGLFQEKVWGDPDFDEGFLLGVESGGELAGWCMGVARQRSTVKIGYIKLMAVEPAYQSRGLGSFLLDQLEQKLFQRGAREFRPFESNPNYLLPGVDPRYTQALLMFQKRGYQKFGETWNMEVELSAQDFSTALAESELRRHGFRFKQAELEDRQALEDFIRAEWEPWLHEVRQSFRLDPPGVHLACCHDGPLAGFAAYDGNNIHTGCFGPMGTHPKFRGKGIGAILLKRCLADLQAQGHRVATIPWVGPVGFYTREAKANIARVFYRLRKQM